jgi:hypothetical protein
MIDVAPLPSTLWFRPPNLTIVEADKRSIELCALRAHSYLTRLQLNSGVRPAPFRTESWEIAVPNMLARRWAELKEQLLNQTPGLPSWLLSQLERSSAVS